MLIQAQAALQVPTLEEVLEFADRLGLPRPVGNRKVFDVWFLALHELGHFATKPLWYRRYAEVIRFDNSSNDKPCAPSIPDLYMLCDPTPGEGHARLWAIQVCEYMNWVNPVVAQPSIFGGSNYNPRQWYVPNQNQLNQKLLKFGVDVLSGKFLADQDDINLPYPKGVELDELMANHDHIYCSFGMNCHTSEYSTAHLVFLNYLSKQLKNRKISVYA
jgi:hypothetical protein